MPCAEQAVGLAGTRVSNGLIGKRLRQCPAMTLADAAADAGPVWLRIIIAFVPPVLAAIIAGYVALSHTVNRRAERLKNLNDMRVSADINRINPDHSLEKIILRELKELDRATSPLKGWATYFRVLVLIIAPPVYIVPVLYSLDLIPASVFSGTLISAILSALGSIITGSYLYYHYWLDAPKLKKDLDQRYDAQMEVLNGLSPAAQKSTQPSPEAQKSADAPAPKAQKSAAKSVVAPGTQQPRRRNTRRR
jgi:hypothetical protein